MKKTKKDKEDKERDYQRLVEEESLILGATELIEELIEESGENRKELAEKLGRSKGFVTQILSGDRNMTLRTLADFAFALQHRVKVAAAPLVESGDGGEAMDAHGPAMARVYGGAGEFLAQSNRSLAGDDPRRPLAAEGAGINISGSYARTIYFNARSGDERPDLFLWENYDPLHASDEREKIAG